MVLLATLDPPTGAELEAIADSIRFGSFDLKRIFTVVALLVACLAAMKIILVLLDRTFRRLDVEKSLRVFIHSALRVVLWLITLCVVLDFIGVPMTSLVAVLSVIGLAVTLAIQGTLSNLAGGIMILVSRPFKADDFIEAGAVGGKVVEVGLAYTKMRTFDNKIISVPNGQISGEKIVNYNTEAERRVDLAFHVSYGDARETVIAAIRRVVEGDGRIHPTPEPFVRMTALKDSGVEYTVRVWCATEDYWEVYYDLLEGVRDAFDQAGVELTYPHLNVHIKEP